MKGKKLFSIHKPIFYRFEENSKEELRVLLLLKERNYNHLLEQTEFQARELEYVHSFIDVFEIPRNNQAEHRVLERPLQIRERLKLLYEKYVNLKYENEMLNNYRIYPKNYF